MSAPGSSHEPAEKPAHKHSSKPQKLNLHNVTLEMIHSFDKIVTEQPIEQYSVWFPFLLEVDRTSSFPFTLEPNKQYDKTLTLKLGSFQPTVTPSQDWTTFVNEVWKHISPYRSRGISAVQYQLTLEPHFTEKEWARIFGAMARAHPGAEESIEQSKLILHQYTLGCYSLEARIRDWKRDERPGDELESFVDSRMKFENLEMSLRNSSVLCHYYRLLLVVKWWTPDERSRFFKGKNYLNQFGAPVYKNITQQAVNEAREFTVSITRERRLNQKRQRGTYGETGDRKPKLRKFIEHDSAHTHLCRTNKYLTAFGDYGGWVRSETLRDLVNQRWTSDSETRNFQPFKLPIKGRTLLPTNRERTFRSERGLCLDCGNHKKDDGVTCTLHPLYEDICLDNRTVFGTDLQKVATNAETATLTSYPLEQTRIYSNQSKAPFHSSTDRAFPVWMEKDMSADVCSLEFSWGLRLSSTTKATRKITHQSDSPPRDC